ncbi:MAG: hypothetical protein J6Z46_05035, partial [Lachnospiraceae bacterium]|nr:hypothetical protein [Lachnospiraceae bacterium]
MRLDEVIVTGKEGLIPNEKNVIGIDIGSRQAKAVLIGGGNIYVTIMPTGFVMDEIAEGLIGDLLRQSGLKRSDIGYIVGTGYGRVGLHISDIPFRMMTEISCHGLGAFFLSSGVKTIVDIGGQDSKAISVDPETGTVTDFAMNDKCAAGTGRFLEKIAEVLDTDVDHIGELALLSAEPETISSQCVVFAESEVVSGRAKGIEAADLAAGVHYSVARRVKALLNRVGIEPGVFFTGGVSNNIGMRKAFEDILGVGFTESSYDTVYAGALGAAVYAARCVSESSGISGEGAEDRISVDEIDNAIDLYEDDYVTRKTGKPKQAAYLCCYTPLEILGASNVAYRRLMHAGTPAEIALGENYTQSVFCDMAKSIIGGFAGENPLFKAVDKLY